MTTTNQIILDEGKHFSKSKFWQAQRSFYHEKGVEAWANEVPFYITSNPFIANTYAKCVLRFLQDWTHKNPDSVDHPFYIIELGAGSGQFSYYVIHTLAKLIKQFKLTHLNVRYLITDFTENNLKFWQQHQQLKPYVDSKLADFALFDLEKDTSLTTVNQEIELTPGSSKNPLIVFANYLFDSVINDIFEVKEKKIYESLVGLSTTKSNLKNESPKDWQKVKINHTEKLIDKGYYDDSILDETLSSYKEELKDSFVLFPIGALRGIQALQNISNQKLLLISSDKGYTNTFELDENDFPELDFHGSFSLMVNYHAIEKYFKLCDGDTFMQSPRDGLTTCVFSSGFKFNELTETSYLLHHSVEGFSPSDFFNFYELIDEIGDEAELKLLASTLCLSQWDPFIFDQIAPRINELFEKENTEIIDYLVDNLPNIEDNFYYVPGCEDVFFSIGLLYYTIDHYKEAIDYYLKSMEYFDPSFETYYNLGLCYFYNEDYEHAQAALQKALDFKPKHKETKKMLKSSESKLKKDAVKKTKKAHSNIT